MTDTCLMKKRQHTKPTSVHFDDWDYNDNETECIASNLCLKNLDTNNFIMENITVTIKKNGPHSRIWIKGDKVSKSSNTKPFNYYLPLEDTSLEKAQELIVDDITTSLDFTEV